jgi:hypothetical protein
MGFELRFTVTVPFIHTQLILIEFIRLRGVLMRTHANVKVERKRSFRFLAAGELRRQRQVVDVPAVSLGVYQFF